MFNKNNFCHVASNNRNEQKAGLFVYKTTDDLDTVLASGYFNEKIIDINLHDVIIHVKTDPTDKTKVEQNVLCVTERTLDNVGTKVVLSQWEGEIDQDVTDILEDIDTIQGDISDIKAKDIQQDGRLTAIEQGAAYKTVDFKTPITSTNKGITQAEETVLNNKIDLAANSGRMITDQGLWYAKMDSATVAPAAEDGTNYADFSQVDGQGNPIIVTYTRVNGAWVQDQTITPPADYDGYVPITSKIWDIPEQAGQQGGRVLWNHQSKEFTPYPQIVSFEDINVTGNSNVIMPQNPGTNQIVNKDYVDNLISNTGTGRNIGDIFFTARTDNELNGAFQCDGATYNTTDFTGAQSIGALLEAGKLPYVSLSDYATALTTNGSVGVFGWDGQGTTAFRVPSLNDIFIETGTAAQIGDYIAPGLPNIKGSWQNYGKSASAGSGAIQCTTQSWGNRDAENGQNSGKYTFDASRSSSIYKDASTTVQPNTVRYRAMVQLAVSATDEAVETCTSVLADVAANTAAIAGADYVIESQLPTADNNYTWYRKYKSGWVEQGGKVKLNGPISSSNKRVSFSVTMANTNYFAMAAADANVDFVVYVGWQDVDGMSVGTKSDASTNTTTWEVKGMSAQ